MTYLQFPDAKHTKAICGPEDKYLYRAAKVLDLTLENRSGRIYAKGEDVDVDTLQIAVQQLTNMAKEDRLILQPRHLEQGCKILSADARADLREYFLHIVCDRIGKPPITPRSVGQLAYVQGMETCDIAFGTGPAGTGKTYMAVAMAVAALKRGEVDRIVICRPAVEAGEQLGFLPGDVNDKMSEYVRPIHDALKDLLPQKDYVRFLKDGTVEICALAFMRGRTFDGCYTLLDEAQNTTIPQMKMFLTRLGNDGKMIITGDPFQVDLPPGKKSGLVDALERFKNHPLISASVMSSIDVVRHPLVVEVLKAYGEK